MFSAGSPLCRISFSLRPRKHELLKRTGWLAVSVFVRVFWQTVTLGGNYLVKWEILTRAEALSVLSLNCL
jgi:hypothetical protein